MSFSTTKLGDEFLYIPRLNVAGINWVVYKNRFLWSIDARGLLDHLEGSEEVLDYVICHMTLGSIRWHLT
jgi:hypothetical protein